MRVLAPLAMVVCLTVGCASSLDQVRQQYAAKLGCKPNQTTARELGPNEYEVSGCGQSTHFTCREESGALACPPSPAIEGAREVPRGPVIAKGDPPPACTELGPVEGKSGVRGYQAIYEKFREEVEKLGGNYGRIDAEWTSGIRGVAYRCP